MRKYRLVAKKGEGTFSEVLKAQNVKDGRYHAIKCMKNRFDSIDQVNNLRETQALRRLSPHEHIISLEEVLYDQPTGRLALVFELMDANLYELIRGRRHYLNPNLIKSYMWQLMKSLDHMHRKGIFHRDIKPENILIESTGEIGKGLKLADFGSCRGIYSKQPYTEYISTRWYRAPECLLTDGYYGPEMDLWGAGCVMFEITSLYPLFPGSNEVDQVNRIHKVLGAPTAELITKFKSKGASHINFDFPPQKGIGIPQLIPHASPESIDLIVKLLKYDASERITAREAMRHPYFKDIREAEAKAQSEKTTTATTTTASNAQQPSATTSVAVNNSTANGTGITAAGTAPISQQYANTNKNLPSINPGNNLGGDHSQLQGKGYSVGAQKTTLVPLTNPNTSSNANNTNNYGAASSSNAGGSSLPPIVSAGVNTGSYGNKFNNSNNSNNNAANMMMSANGNNMLASSNNSVNNSTTGSNANNSQKRKKRYRVNQQRAAQNSENIMKAYGIPKYSTGGTGAMMTAEGSGLLGGGSNISSNNNNNNNLKVMGGISGGGGGGGGGANYSAQNRGAYGNAGKKY